MRNHARDVVDREPGLIEDGFCRGQHGDDGLLVNVLAGHLNGLEILVRVFARDGCAATPPRHEKDVGELAVAAYMRGDHSVRPAAMPQNRRTSAVAEKDTRVAIGPIGDGTEFFRADDEHRFVSVRSDELLRDFDCDKKTCACCRDVETSCFRCSDLGLHQAGRGREHHVGRGGREENEIDFLR